MGFQFAGPAAGGVSRSGILRCRCEHKTHRFAKGIMRVNTMHRVCRKYTPLARTLCYACSGTIVHCPYNTFKNHVPGRWRARISSRPCFDSCRHGNPRRAVGSGASLDGSRNISHPYQARCMFEKGAKMKRRRPLDAEFREMGQVSLSADR